MSQFRLTNMLRVNNGVYYVSPEFGGFRGRLTYSMGDERTRAPKDAGVVWGASGEYISPTLSAGAYYQSRKVIFPAGSTRSESSVYQGMGALYNFGSWAIDAGYARFDPAGPDTSSSGVTTGIWTGLLVKFGSSDVRVNIGRIKTSLSAPTSARSTMLGLNYSYYLSKRSTLYAGIGHVANNDMAQVPLEAGTRPILASNGLGSDVSAVIVGLRHAF